MVDGRLELGFHSKTYALPTESQFLSSCIFSDSCLLEKTKMSLEIWISKALFVRSFEYRP